MIKKGVRRFLSLLIEVGVSSPNNSMNIKRVMEPKLYVEDDYGNFENIFETGDQLTITLKSGKTVSGGLTYIEDDLLEIENFDTEETEKIKFTDIESIFD